MAIILNIESSTDICSVVLAKDGEIVCWRENRDGRSHATLLTQYVKDVCEESSISISELDAIAISGGPGSYTGLRIGVSAAKGICFGAGKPLIALSGLECMASGIKSEYNIDGDQLLIPMLDARRMEVYTSTYNSSLEMVAPISAKIIDETSFKDELERGEVLFFGNGADKCKDVIINPNAKFIGDVITSAKSMVALSEKAFNESNFVDVAYYEPFYLKDFVATVSKKDVYSAKRY